MTMRGLHSIGAALILSVALLSQPAAGGDRRRAVAVSLPSDPLALTFVGAAGGVVDSGTIVWRGGSRPFASSVQTVRVLIGRASAEPTGTATLTAFLENADARCTVRIDGIVLTKAPRTIQRHAPIGVPVAHRIEIEVPRTAGDGPLLMSIGWEVTTD